MTNLIHIIDVIIWPLMIVICVYLLRAPLFELIPQLKKLKYKDLELEFENDLNALEKKLNKSKENRQLGSLPEEDNNYYLAQVKELSPRGAIMKAWINMESSAISTATKFIPSLKDKKYNFNAVLKELKKNNILNAQDINNINELRALRNKSAHEPNFSISEEEAAKFMEIAREQADIIIGEIWGKYGGCSH